MNQPENTPMHRDYAAVLITAALCVNTSKSKQLTIVEILALLHAVNDPTLDASPFNDLDGYCIQLHKRLNGALPIHRIPGIVEAAVRAMPSFCALMNEVGEQYTYFSHEAAPAAPAPAASPVEPPPAVIQVTPASTPDAGAYGSEVVARYAAKRQERGLPPLHPDKPMPLAPKKRNPDAPDLGKDVIADE